MLQPITGETFRGPSANVLEGARLDIAGDGFWGGVILRELLWTFVFSIPTYAASNQHQQQPAVYRKHESEKKRTSEQRIREVEHCSFMPLVMSSTGGLGNSATACLLQETGFDASS